MKALRIYRVAALFAAAVILAGCSAAAETESQAEAENRNGDNGVEWFYETFDDAQAAAYDAFRISAERPFESEPVLITDKSGKRTPVPVSDLAMVYQGFLYDHPEIFWLSSSYNYRVSVMSGGEETADAVSVIPIPESESELNARKKEFENAANEILDKTLTEAGDGGKAQILYDCLTAGTEYEIRVPKVPAFVQNTQNHSNIWCRMTIFEKTSAGSLDL